MDAERLLPGVGHLPAWLSQSDGLYLFKQDFVRTRDEVLQSISDNEAAEKMMNNLQLDAETRQKWEDEGNWKNRSTMVKKDLWFYVENVAKQFQNILDSQPGCLLMREWATKMAFNPVVLKFRYRHFVVKEKKVDDSKAREYFQLLVATCSAPLRYMTRNSKEIVLGAYADLQKKAKKPRHLAIRKAACETWLSFLDTDTMVAKRDASLVLNKQSTTARSPATAKSSLSSTKKTSVNSPTKESTMKRSAKLPTPPTKKRSTSRPK